MAESERKRRVFPDAFKLARLIPSSSVTEVSLAPDALCRRGPSSRFKNISGGRWKLTGSGQVRGTSPRASRPGWLEPARNAGEQLGRWMRGGECDTHSRRGFDDARGHLDQLQP